MRIGRSDSRGIGDDADPMRRIRVRDRSVRAAAGGESHQRRVEVGVSGRLLGTRRVARELVPIAGPAAIGDSLLDLALEYDGELGRGAAPRPLPPKAVAALGRGAGIELIDIAPGSPAGLAGLLPEDIVVAVNGKPIESVEELQRQLSAEAIGTPQSLTVVRSGTLMELEVRPVELAA